MMSGNDSPERAAVTQLFQHIGNDRIEQAKQTLTNLAYPNGVDQPPSPAARPYVDNTGEWDGQLVRIIRVSTDLCCALVGPSSVKHEYPQIVCARAKATCSYASHQRSGSEVVNYTQGWRILQTNKVQGGVKLTPYLKFGSGCAIDDVVGERLDMMMTEEPARGIFSIGQWSFVFDTWNGRRPIDMEVVEDDDDEGQGHDYTGDDDEEKEEETKEETMEDEDNAEDPQGHDDDPQDDHEDDQEDSDDEERPIPNINGAVREMFKHIKRLTTLVNESTRERDEDRKKIRLLTRQVSSLDGKIGVLDDSNKILKDKVEQLKRHVTTSDKKVETNHRDLTAEVRDVQVVARRAETTAIAARSGTSSLSSQMSGGGAICFYGLVFSSPTEWMTFYRSERIEPGTTGDAFFLMNQGRNVIRGNEDALNARKKRADTNLATPLDSEFRSSFETALPASLCPSRAASADATSVADVLKKLMKEHTVWEPDDASCGIRVAVENSIDHYQGRINAFSRGRNMSEKGMGFCQKLLNDSERFARALCLFISSFYTTTLKTSGMKPTTVWDLCLEVVGHIFGEIVKERNVVVDSGMCQPGMYVWGLLRAWEVQERYMKNNFSDDPALNGIFVRRAVLRKDECLSALEKEVKLIKEKLNKKNWKDSDKKDSSSG